MNFETRTGNMYPALEDFTTVAAGWKEFEENVVYQIVSTKIVHTHHGQSVVLSLQKEDGTCKTAWVCGMLSAELLANPMLTVNSNLFVVATGEKTSKMSGRVYNSYRLVSL